MREDIKITLTGAEKVFKITNKYLLDSDNIVVDIVNRLIWDPCISDKKVEVVLFEILEFWESFEGEEFKFENLTELAHELNKYMKGEIDE